MQQGIDSRIEPHTQQQQRKRGRKKQASVRRKTHTNKDMMERSQKEKARHRLIFDFSQFADDNQLFLFNLYKIHYLAQQEQKGIALPSLGSADLAYADLFLRENIRKGWKTSEEFLTWAFTHNDFTPLHTLTRKDCTQPFSPENCVWVYNRDLHNEDQPNTSMLLSTLDLSQLFYSERHGMLKTLNAWYVNHRNKNRCVLSEFFNLIFRGGLSLDETLLYPALDAQQLQEGKLYSLCGWIIE